MQIRLASTRTDNLELCGRHHGYMWIIFGKPAYGVTLYLVYSGIPLECLAKLHEQPGHWSSMQRLTTIFGGEPSYYGLTPFRANTVNTAGISWWCGMNHEYTGAMTPSRYCISGYRGEQPRTLLTTLQVGIEMCGRMADFHELD